ncbi:MAG: arsenite S-adenosylmethyltransferase [Acidobacteria bacterium]|nr:MAG: arsenite S-adenosylmethyltransferase [Acidobacteriota bacterium]
MSRGKRPARGGARMETKMAVPAEQLVERVRERYGRIAEGAETGCCGPKAATACCGGDAAVSAKLGYQAKDLAAVPEGANLGLGCGAPLDFLELRPGEAVLDLGSGPGLDAFLAADRVGPSGRVIGVDMTPAMLERAQRNAARGGYANVEFREGRLESLPLGDAVVDAVTSNCVINLVPDKAAVFRQVARVLKPGGRLVVSDIVLDGRLPEALEQDLYAYVGCVSGAVDRRDYFGMLEAAGLGPVEVLKDVDYLAAIGNTVPEEVQAVLDRTGIRSEDVAGKVRSITYRAYRRA